MRRIAECYDCLVNAYVDNAPSVKVPAPVYGAYGMAQHAGHDVRPARSIYV